MQTYTNFEECETKYVGTTDVSPYYYEEMIEKQMEGEPWSDEFYIDDEGRLQVIL
jgi:hypothetical protein